MTVNSIQIQGAAVRTVSGVKLGKVASVDIDADTGRLATLRVSISRMLPAGLGPEALVGWSQIVTLSDKEVVVADAFAAEREGWINKSFAAQPTHLSTRDAGAPSSEA